jgi:hypothetical protein
MKLGDDNQRDFARIPPRGRCSGGNLGANGLQSPAQLSRVELWHLPLLEKIGDVEIIIIVIVLETCLNEL